MRRVVSASTTPESAGFGNIPPKAWKTPSAISHRLKAAFIGEARALAEQIEFVPLELRRGAGEEQQAERGPRGRRLADSVEQEERLVPQLQSLKSTWRKLHFACLKLLSQRLRGLR